MVKNEYPPNLRPFKELWNDIPLDPMIFEIEAAKKWVKNLITEVQEEYNLEKCLTNDLVTILSDFIKNENLNIILLRNTDTALWLETGTGSFSIICLIDNDSREILYDIYSRDLNTHLKMETIKDLENLIYIEEESQDWEMTNDLEEIWLILDEMKFWGYHNQFEIKELDLI